MKRKTNVQIVADLMNYSEYGAMSQLFIIDAITKQAEAVAKMDPEELEKSKSFQLINPRAWVGVAKEIQERLNKMYEEVK